MNKDNCCFDYVCTCSGCKRAWKRHDIFIFEMKCNLDKVKKKLH